MIKLQGKLPKKISLAVSGGVDSMVALDFLKKKHEVTVLHYNHGTAHGMEAEDFVTDYCRKNSLEKWDNFMLDESIFKSFKEFKSFNCSNLVPQKYFISYL